MRRSFALLGWMTAAVAAAAACQSTRPGADRTKPMAARSATFTVHYDAGCPVEAPAAGGEPCPGPDAANPQCIQVYKTDKVKVENAEKTDPDFEVDVTPSDLRFEPAGDAAAGKLKSKYNVRVDLAPAQRYKFTIRLKDKSCVLDPTIIVK